MLTFAAALLVAFAAAENLLNIEPERRELGHIVSPAPNLDKTEANCKDTTVYTSSRVSYKYEWNTTGCFCEHIWTSGYYKNPGGVSPSKSYCEYFPDSRDNPVHEPGNSNRTAVPGGLCMKTTDYNNNPAFNG